MNEFNPYLLIAPAVMVFLSIALVSAWNYERRQHALVWMALGIFSTSISLGVQSVLTPAHISQYAIYTAVFYLAGAWFTGLSIAERYHVSYYPKVAVLVCLLTLCSIYYFSRVQESLPTRAYILSIALGVLHVLPVFNVIKCKPNTDRLDVFLYWSYLVFCVYTAARPLTLFIFDQIMIVSLVQSIYWFLTLLGSILFCMTFAFLLLGSSVRSTLNRLYAERNLDPLTNLLNRRAFEENVELQIDYQNTFPTSVLMGDIDYFKTINDTWGHDFGDKVLRNVALCLEHTTRHGDLVTRFGGEEFVLLLPHTDIEMAHKIAQRIQSLLAEAKYQLPDQSTLTMSFGISGLRPGETVHHALKRADVALYQAKKSGRNRICIDAKETEKPSMHPEACPSGLL